MQTRNIPLLLLLGLGTGSALASCRGTEPNPDHCWAGYGDVTCAKLYPDGDRPYCTNEICDSESEGFYGCVAARPTDECYSPCGGEESILEDNLCPGIADEGTDTDTGSDSSAMDSGSDTGSPPCMPQDCPDVAAPFCGDAGECVACDGTADPDAACAGLDVGMPVCVAGACVECAEAKADACTATTPVCDVEQNACVGCTEHEECPESACNLKLGNCMDPANVVHVDGDGGEAFTTLGAALAANTNATELTIILHQKSGDPVAYPGVEIYQNDYVAILAAPDEKPVVTGGEENPALDVTTGSMLFLRGVSASNTANGGVGLRLGAGAAWVQECRILNNTGGGILLTGASSSLILENSFVGGNVSDVPAVDVASGTADILASTLAGGPAGSPALVCSAGQAPTVRNSLLVSRQAEPEVQCMDAVLTHNALEMVVAGNVSLGDMPDTSWFTSYMNGDFHLDPGMVPAAIASAATWMPGDPRVDIDGEPRPIAEGPDFAGADRIP